MTYIVKQMNDGLIGIYDTERASFPIAMPELKAAGIDRIEGTATGGWFKKADREQAEAIAATLNTFYNHPEYVESVVAVVKAKAAPKGDDLADVAAALIADQAGV